MSEVRSTPHGHVRHAIAPESFGFAPAPLPDAGHDALRPRSSRPKRVPVEVALFGRESARSRAKRSLHRSHAAALAAACAALAETTPSGHRRYSRAMVTAASGNVTCLRLLTARQRAALARAAKRDAAVAVADLCDTSDVSQRVAARSYGRRIERMARASDRALSRERAAAKRHVDVDAWHAATVAAERDAYWQHVSDRAALGDVAARDALRTRLAARESALDARLAECGV